MVIEMVGVVGGSGCMKLKLYLVLHHTTIRLDPGPSSAAAAAASAAHVVRHVTCWTVWGRWVRVTEGQVGCVNRQRTMKANIFWSRRAVYLSM